ncbi:MAG: 3-hydroxyacyl-CoA dehydrogenase [Glaciihabitans sp.]|nr:3-hydroxyacyl-CoA dehydrogenase [Glaciihabitans sp.]MCU1535638.1 3-hydroxyacyl-CoA dehydrogenase [Glaciihabitans sp.]
MTSQTLRVAVVGSGYMGKGIAQTLARAGATITLIDRDAEVARAALDAMIGDAVAAEAAGLADPGSAEVVRRNSSSADLESGLAGAEFVVEAVFEELSVKHAVLAAIEANVSESTVIGTNTSAIPVGVLATALRHPERFFGVHWFNPAPYLPGIEIILGEASDPALLDDVTALLVRAGKKPVVVADTPGFIANRLQFALFKEAASMVEDGTATPQQIDEVVKSGFGFRLPFFGPFAIADMAGLDVYASSYATLSAGLGSRFDCPPSLAERIAKGDLGTKTGGGYLGMSKEESAEMASRRDRSYVALARLRAELESEA